MKDRLKLPKKFHIFKFFAGIAIIFVPLAALILHRSISNAELEKIIRSPAHLSYSAPDDGIDLAASFTVTSSSSLDISSNTASEEKKPFDQLELRLPVRVENKETLYLKLLTRPFAKIFETPDEKKVKYEKVDAFRIYYAYSTPDQTPGFYEVGLDDRGHTIGYMRAEDVIEWKQYLTLRFNNKEDKRTLFFKNLSDVEKLAYSENRIRDIREIRQKIDAIGYGIPLPENFPVAAVEPPEYVNIYVKPYLLPILNFKLVSLDGKTTRFLKVASAVKSERKPDSGSMSIEFEGFAKSSISMDLIKSFKADVVFVIDTTVSMQPYIIRTRRAVQQIAESMADVSGNISFGLVAYRDDPTMVPGLEYRTKIYCNLEEGSDINTFMQKVSMVRQATVASIGFDEDVWAGIYTAIKDRAGLKRRDNATLFIIHIGDAGAHDYTGQTDFNAESIGQMAEDEYGKSNSKAWIFSFHLKTPEAKKANNVQKAEAQFRTMVSKLNGVKFYYPIDDGSPQEFADQTNRLVNSFIDAIKSTRQGIIPGPAEIPAEEDEVAAVQAIDSAVKAAIRAAVLERVGTKKTADGEVGLPRDILAWTLDRDLENPERRPMDTMLLITRNDLDALRDSLQNVLLAGRTQEMSSEDFFDQLQSVMTSVMREPKMIRKGVKPGRLTLGKIGILPEFIEGLPYKTQVINLSIDRYSRKSTGWQKNFMNTLKSKIAQYEEYYKNNDIWIELNEGDKAGNHVTFLEIDRLP